jgi:integrase
MAKELTAKAVEKTFKAGKKRREILDSRCKGLYLVIETTGTKSWALRFRRPNGEPAKLHLGPVDFSGKEPKDVPVRGTPLTLSGARALAAEIHRKRKIDRDRDVVADYLAEKRRQRAATEASLKNTFAAAARDFIEQHAQPKVRRWPEMARLLGLDPKNELALISGGLAAGWADKPIAQIDGHDIYGVIEETRRKGAPGLERRSHKPTESRARAMLSALSKMFNWLMQHRKVETNPCAGLHRETPKARERVLTDAEVRAFWQGCDQVGEPFGQALKILLLTGCRLNEVAGMQRAELEDGVWTIPPTRTKNRRTHVLPLSPMVIDLLKSVKPIAGSAGFVFTTTGKTPINGWSKVKKRFDAAMKPAQPWRLHDLRRTAASGMQRLGVRSEVIERALNHVSGSFRGVAGIYQRDPMTEDVQAALERWASHVEGLVSGKPGNVLDLATKRGRK